MLTETPPATAGIIFFKMANSRSRNEMIDKLKKRRFGTDYSLFWNSYIKRVRVLDEIRNQIVHWHGAAEFHGPGNIRFVLSPPNAWTWTSDTPRLDVNDLSAFSMECQFLYRTLNIFMAAVQGKTVFGDETPEASLQRFHEPVAYPPLDTHPLFRIYEVLRNQRRP